MNIRRPLPLFLAFALLVAALAAPPAAPSQAAQPAQAGGCAALPADWTASFQFTWLVAGSSSDGNGYESRSANVVYDFEPVNDTSWQASGVEGFTRIDARWNFTNSYIAAQGSGAADTSVVGASQFLRFDLESCTYSINMPVVGDFRQWAVAPFDVRSFDGSIVMGQLVLREQPLNWTPNTTDFTISDSRVMGINGDNCDFYQCFSLPSSGPTEYLYDLPGGLGKVSVSWSITPKNNPSCAGRPAPISADDPVLLKQEGALVDTRLIYDQGFVAPDGIARVVGYVTCQGVPVANARVLVGGDVVENSGGHLHNAGRPKGYLNNVKITPANSAATIEVRSDNEGKFTFAFQPGRDTRFERIGIAGTYELNAYALNFPFSQSYLTIDAKVPNLQQLPTSGEEFYYPTGQTLDHLSNHWGTPATIAAIRRISADFLKMQQANNQILVSVGQEPWPLANLYVDDISLRWGGLFDVRGWDAAAGRVRGEHWQPPHYTHTTGEEVDFSTARFIYGLRNDSSGIRTTPMTPDEIARAMRVLRAMLRFTGDDYGTWIGGPTFTLRVGQGGALRTALAAAGPDPEVAIFPEDATQEQHPVVASGQTVRLALVAHNLGGDATANAVALRATLPAGLSFSNATPAPTRLENGQPVWELGDLPGGAASVRDLLLEATVAPGLAAGTPLTTSVELTTGSADGDGANNRAETGLVVQPLGPDLLVESSLEQRPLVAGQTGTFSVTVTNYGTAPAQGADLSLTLPVSTTFKSATPAPTSNVGGRSPRWNLGTLAPRESRIVTLTLDVDMTAMPSGIPGASAPLLRFTLQAGAGAQADTFADDNLLVVERAATLAGADLRVDLRTAGLAGTGGAQGGQELTITLPYGNGGNQPATASAVLVTLGTGLELIEAQPAPGSQTPPTVEGKSVRWNLDTLAEGAQGELTLRVRATAISATGATISAEATSESYDLDGSNDAATTTIWQSSGGSAGQQYRVYLPSVIR